MNSSLLSLVGGVEDDRDDDPRSVGDSQLTLKDCRRGERLDEVLCPKPGIILLGSRDQLDYVFADLATELQGHEAEELLDDDTVLLSMDYLSDLMKSLGKVIHDAMVRHGQIKAIDETRHVAYRPWLPDNGEEE